MVFNSANTVSWPRRRVLMRQPLLVQHQNETTTLPSEFVTFLRFQMQIIEVRTSKSRQMSAFATTMRSLKTTIPSLLLLLWINIISTSWWRMKKLTIFDAAL